MFDKKLAVEIADRMRKAGKRPSIRTVRLALAEVGKSGSLRRVGDVLRDWRQDHGLSEFEADTGVPPEFQTRIDAVTMSLWEAAKSRADAVWREERLRLSRERDDARRDVDAAAAELKGAKEQLRASRLEVEAQTTRADKAEADQKRRAMEFWDRVMLAVYRLLKKEGRAMGHIEILEGLSEDLYREAYYHAEDLDEKTLSKKLGERHKWARYVAPAEGNDKWKHRNPEEAKPRTKPRSAKAA